MADLYPALKLLHVITALLSISGFVLRGMLRVWWPVLAQHRVCRILPHVNDSLLLACGVTLAIIAGLNPLQYHWLAAKLVLLLAYIVLGMMAFRWAQTPAWRIAAFFAALVTFAAIGWLALEKPW